MINFILGFYESVPVFAGFLTGAIGIGVPIYAIGWYHGAEAAVGRRLDAFEDRRGTRRRAGAAASARAAEVRMIWLIALFAFNAIVFAALYFRPLATRRTPKHSATPNRTEIKGDRSQTGE